MKKIAAVVCIAIPMLSFAQTVGAEVPIDGYKDTTFGMTLEDVRKIHPQVMQGSTDLYGDEDEVLFFTRELLGAPCGVSFYFHPSKGLSMICLSLRKTDDEGLFPRLLSILSIKYGAPFEADGKTAWADADGDYVVIRDGETNVEVAYAANWCLAEVKKKRRQQAEEF
jgi:hypothetical protein